MSPRGVLEIGLSGFLTTMQKFEVSAATKVEYSFTAPERIITAKGTVHDFVEKLVVKMPELKGLPWDFRFEYGKCGELVESIIIIEFLSIGDFVLHNVTK